MRANGFTLIELLVVIGIMTLLMGMLFPLVGMILDSSRKTRATSLVSALHLALRAYAAEDSSHRFPPVEADGTLRSTGDLLNPRTIDRLVPTFINAGIEHLEAAPDGAGAWLVDPWGRPYRYRVDAVADGTVQRPDPARVDWNARGLEPFAYVWSLGKPQRGSSGSGLADDADAVAGSGAPWIYVTTSAAAP